MMRRRRSETADERLDRLIQQEMVARGANRDEGMELRRLQLEASGAGNADGVRQAVEEPLPPQPHGAPEVYGPDAALVPLFEDVMGGGLEAQPAGAADPSAGDRALQPGLPVQVGDGQVPRSGALPGNNRVLPGPGGLGHELPDRRRPRT